MQRSHVILVLLIALCFHAPVGKAYESIESFFARDDHQAQFLLLQTSGQMAKQRQLYLDHCQKAATNDLERSQCACAHKSFAQLSDRLFYYNSVMAYEDFMARSAAKPEEREALRAQQAERPNAMDDIIRQCQEQLPDPSRATTKQ